MGEKPAATSAVLRGSDAFYTTWEHLDRLKDQRRDMQDVADRAYTTFIDAARRVGAVHVDWEEVPKVNRQFDMENIEITLAGEFWDDYAALIS
jgi:hypothetical protein